MQWRWGVPFWTTINATLAKEHGDAWILCRTEDYRQQRHRFPIQELGHSLGGYFCILWALYITSQPLGWHHGSKQGIRCGGSCLWFLSLYPEHARLEALFHKQEIHIGSVKVVSKCPVSLTRTQVTLLSAQVPDFYQGVFGYHKACFQPHWPSLMDTLHRFLRDIREPLCLVRRTTMIQKSMWSSVVEYDFNYIKMCCSCWTI